MKKRNLLLSTVAVGLAAQAMPAAAQDDSDIIVTARKRQESILKVPVVENVVTQQRLEQYQITDVVRLSAKVPGLNFGAAVLSIGPQVSLRGVGTSTLDAGVDQSVSLNVDGLSMSQGLAYKAGLFDLQQAEVLKGPQALFFGKNSPGGVISLRTADPGDSVEVIGRLAYEIEARQRRAELILSGPLTQTFGIRLAGTTSDSQGFFHNPAQPLLSSGAQEPNHRFSATRSLILRGTAVWKPTSDFDARLKVNYTKDKINGDANQGQLASCPEGTTAANYTGIPFINPNDDCKLDRTLYVVALSPAAFPGIRNGGDPFFDLRQKFGTLELTYRPTDALTATSVSGFYDARVDTMINGTQSGFAATALYADNAFHRRDYTQEFRLDSEFNSPLNFTAGAFYQDGSIYNRIIVGGNTFFGLPRLLVTGSHKIDIKTYSGFGQLRWKPIEQIELTGGVRYTDEKRSDTPFNLASGMPVFVAAKTPNIRSKTWSPEVTVTYTPTDDLTFFGSLKQGYKSGSFTITTPVGTGIDNSFGDEKVRGGEAGIKTRLFDRALNVNLAGYYYIYKGLQVGANEPAQNGIPIIRTLNAGSAKVYGVDFDMTYRAPFLDGLTLNAAINYNHAHFTSLDNVPCYGGQTIALGCNGLLNTSTGAFTSQNLNGTRLVRAPDWQGTGGFQYETPMSNGLKFSFGSDGRYSSKYPTGLGLRRDFYQKGYFSLSANAAISGANDGWELSVAGNNITNKIRAGSCTALNYAGGQILPGVVTGRSINGASGQDELSCVTQPGREVWIRLTLRPGNFIK